MSKLIVHLIGLLLRRLLPPSGRRRQHPGRATVVLPGITARPPVTPTRPRVSIFRGEDSRLVRPYLLAHERLAGVAW
ncbi:hypothetical protein ACFVQ4_01120 [Streptomyces laurentii]|uniref:hypothetical protein n=1 Tax=Streptomyces laurentii TaxID=39478 RepID=UPI003684AED2